MKGLTKNAHLKNEFMEDEKFPNKGVEPYSPKGPGNVKITTISLMLIFLHVNSHMTQCFNTLINVRKKISSLYLHYFSNVFHSLKSADFFGIVIASSKHSVELIRRVFGDN